MLHRRGLVIAAALSLLGAIQRTLAHEHGDNLAPSVQAEAPAAKLDLQGGVMNSSVALPQSYFARPESSGVLLAHVVLMVVAWFFILPIGVVLSLARSRLALVSQLLFLGANGLGLLLGKIYNLKTPDLYEGNMHHSLGWALSVILMVQFVVRACQTYASVGTWEKTNSEEHEAFIPISAQVMEHHEAIQGLNEQTQSRFSRDSGHGTDPETFPSQSVTPSLEEPRKLEEDTLDMNSGRTYDGSHSANSGILLWLSRMLSGRTLRVLNRLSDMTDVLILPLGFVAVISGMVIYGGVFRGSNVLNGLAHTIKGGIFFWYGLLTLGRWMGAFAEYGWAWNVKPSREVIRAWKAAVPSAEFVESLVIFTYGATNMFLEHLAAWGGAWTAQDLEHVSISIMFFGGGLCGMLVESQRIRNFLNATMTTAPTEFGHSPSLIDRWEPPKTYPFSLNPFPALIILLLGLMMSSHHQASSISTMIHKQWGTLLVGFAVARALTYILIYIAPPQSFLPSRPPTEIVTSFCLISGGIIFMLSNKDTVAAMDRYQLNAMFSFTLTMGFTAFLMAWTMTVLAVKGWAIGRKKTRGISHYGGS